MRGRVSVRSTMAWAVVAGIVCSASLLAQQPAQGQGARGGGGGGGARPAPAVLTLKVEWRATKGTEQVPIVQGTVVDPNLELKMYGDGKRVLNPGGGDATTVWSGEAEGPLAVTFRPKDHMMDLTGQARIRWVTKTSGFHVVRPVVKLADGTLMVGTFASANVPMLAMTEFPIATIRWIKLDPMRVVTVSSPGNQNNEIWVQNPDLSKVDEVGFADLMPGSGHGTGGYIHIGSIEVYGKTIPRTATTSASR